MLRIYSNWPIGIQQFWRNIGRASEIGEGSGFFIGEGRLEMHRCFNEQLNDYIVREKEHIKVLVIRKNELNETSYKIISELTNLQKLVLESVGSYILSLDVSKLDKLTDVVIGSASNTELPEWVFSIKNLKSLNISNTRIEELPDQSKYEAFHNLEKLDISYTAIERLPEFGGRKLDKLRELRVAHTSLEDIPSCYFTGSLRLLDCSSTRIESLDHFDKAENLEMFRCSDNNYLECLSGLRIEGLRVLDISHCQKLKNLPDNKNYSNLELISICGNFFDTLPLSLLEHCIEKQLRFRQIRFKSFDEFKYDNGELTKIQYSLRGIYIEGTFFKQMNLSYLLDNDLRFLDYYARKEKNGELHPKHEARIMLLGDEKDAQDLFIQKLFPDYPQIYFMEYGGLRVLDTAGGELDYVRQQLDRDANISIWAIDNGINERFMHHILFSDDDFFIVVMKENVDTNYQERAVCWLKEIEQYVRYATIGFVIVGKNEEKPVIISLKEVEQECQRKYFRFLNEVFYLNINNMETYTELTNWLVEGIREKSNYEMKIIPKWKSLRRQIVSYLNLRRVVNEERFESLLSGIDKREKKAFINYLIESKSIFRIEYLEKEVYYFKTEWVISALFSLLSVFRKGNLKDPFEIDDLRMYLQIENIDFLDFFQDSESLGYLMGLLEDIGIVYKDGNRYYGLLMLKYMDKDDEIYETIRKSDLITYKATYSMLTEQMVPKITAELIKTWINEDETVDKVKKYKGYLVFDFVDNDKFAGNIVIKIIPGCPGMLLFYIVEPDNISQRNQIAIKHWLKRWVMIFLDKLQDLQSFPLWTAKLSVYHRVNEISSFISLEEIENYVNSGYASAFMAQYNAFVDIDEIYDMFWI